MATDNKSLGRFILDGIPPAPRGVPQVEVTFDIDANGILNVTAKDKASGKVQSIKITGSTGLSKEEVEKMTKEAEMNSAEDAVKKDKVEARNHADSLIFTSEKALKDGGDKVPAEVKTEVEDKIKKLKEILDTGSKEELETRSKDLSETLSKIGQAAYQQGQQTQAQEEIEQEEKEGKTDSQEKAKNDKKNDEPVEGEVVE